MIRYRPTYEEFARLLGTASCIPVYRQLTGDGLTPVSAFARIERSAPSFLFESVIGGEKVGRFSFLGTEPFLKFEARGNEVTITETAVPGSVRRLKSADPFRELQALVESYRAVHLKGLPRFAGGAVGYASYDAVRYTENLPAMPPDDRGLPDLSFAFYDRMVLFDHIRKTILVVAQAHVGPGRDPQAAYQTACDGIDEFVDRLGKPGPDLGLRDVDTESPVTLQPRSNFTRADYEAVVRHCQEYIKAGDIFRSSQASVSRSRRRPPRSTSTAFYRVVNPSPFLFYLPHGDFALIGSSPEILVRVEDGDVTIRPLAGTRRRGTDEAEDRALAEELLADPKEHPEHIMLVDLGPTTSAGWPSTASVRLTDVMKVERYSHVMHITSNVTGQLREGQLRLTPCAGLPAGTVSAPPRSGRCKSSTRSSRKNAGRTAGRSAILILPETWTHDRVAHPGDSGEDGVYPGRRRRGLRQ